MNNKLGKLVAMLLVPLSALAGCAKNGASKMPNEPETADVGTKEIIFWNIGTEEVDKRVYETAIEMFHEATQSGYRVTSVPVQNDIYKEKLIIAMSSDDCPDMYTHWSGGPMNEYIEAGYAQVITELFNATEMPNRLMDAAIARATYKNDIFAVPFKSVSLSGFYYNKEMFKKYRLQIPSTLSELEKICETLKENGVTPFALANATKWPGSMYFMNLAVRKGGLEPFLKAVGGTGTFEDECFIFAGSKIREWSEKGYFPKGVNSLSEDNGQGRQLLYQEMAAMDLIGSWYTGVIKQDSEEFYAKTGWFPFPSIEGSNADTSIMIGTIGDNFISFDCEGEKLAAAVECASMFSTPEMVDYIIQNGQIPPVKGVSEKLSDPISKQIIEAAIHASSTKLWYDQCLPPAVAQVHLDTSQELFGLTMSSADAAKKFQDAMQEYLNH